MKIKYILSGVLVVIIIIMVYFGIVIDKADSFDVYLDNNVYFGEATSKVLGVATNEDEVSELINKYNMDDYYFRNLDYSNNYAFVYYSYNSCSEEVYFDKRIKNTLHFDLERHCGNCANMPVVTVVTVPKNITSVDVKFNYDKGDKCDHEYTVDKPVLYLYPESDINVSVRFDRDDLLKTTYPKYNDRWDVFVKKDGTIVDKNNRSYYGLYWDEKINHIENFDTGFYVRSEDSIKFLEDKLELIGLNEREANEFIMYWLPKMEENGDNLVHFEFTDFRESNNKLIINPPVDSLLRFSIEIKKVNNYVPIKEQEISHFERVGFTAVEWGGTIYE